MVKPSRYLGTLPDGSKAIVLTEENSVKLEIDREHQHPREMFEGQEIPERLAINLDRSKVATLTGLYRTRRSSNMVASHEIYEANLAFVGPTEFMDEPTVTRVFFRPSNEMLAVMYRGHRVSRYVQADDVTISQIEQAPRDGTRFLISVIDQELCQAFTVETDDLNVIGHVRVGTNSNMHGLTVDETRQVELAYPNPVGIHAAIGDMISICDFMSLMVGEVISPTGVSISTDGPTDRWGRKPYFEVVARWRQTGKDIDPQYGHRCLCSPMLNAETYVNALSSWINRREQWSQSNSLATVCLANQREISRRRFLDAAAWFESVPTFYERPRDKIGRDVIAAASAAASAAFTDGGADVKAERVQALLGSVNSASLAVRVADAINRVRTFAGHDVIPAKLDELARLLPRIRGRFAHGEDAFLSDLGHLVHDATLLFEVLSAALTLEALGLTINIEAAGHPIRDALVELRQYGADEQVNVD